MEFTKEGRKIQVKTAYGDPLVAKLKEENFKWNAQAKVWEKGYTQKLWAWLEGLQQEKSNFAAAMSVRKESGLMLKHSKSYDCRDRIKELGGVWDKINKGWLMPSEEALNTAKRICEDFAFAAANAKPQKKVSEPSFFAPEYGKQYQSGQFFKMDGAWHRVTRTKNQYDADGTEVFYRPATEEEIARIEADLAKKEVQKQVKELATNAMSEGERPEVAEINVPLVSVDSRLYLAVEEDVVWVLWYNGSDGDDWRGNNYRNSYRAYKAPESIASEIRSLVSAL